MSAEVVVQSGHAQSTDALVFSDDGRVVASGSSDGTVKLWTSDALLLLRTLRPAYGPVGALAFSDDGRRILSGHKDGSIVEWEAQTGRMLRRRKGHSAPVRSLVMMPDAGRLLSASEDGTVRLWDLVGGTVRTVLRHRNAKYDHLAVAPDGRSYAVVESDGSLVVGRLAGNAVVRSPPHASARSVGWLDATHVLVATSAGDLLTWDVRAGRLSGRVSAPGAGVGADPVFSRDGQRAAIGDKDGSVAIVGLQDQTRTVLHAHTDFISALTFDAGAKRLLTVGNDDVMRIWSTDADGRKLVETSARVRVLEALVAGKETPLLLSGDIEGSLAVWDQFGGENLKALKYTPGLVHSSNFAVSSDGAEAMTSTRSDFSDDNETVVLSLRGGPPFVVDSTGAAAMAPDGSVVVTFGAKVAFWDVRKRQLMREAPGVGKVALADFSADGSSIATAGIDGDLRIVDARTGASGPVMRAKTSAVSAVAVSGDGGVIALGGYDNLVEVWSTETRRLLTVFAEHAAPISSVALSRDGRLVLSASRDGTVKVWDVPNARRLAEFKGHIGNVLCVTLLKDERLAASAGLDGAIRIWTVRDGKEVAAFVSNDKGEWISITPQGFFRESARGDASPVHIVRGLEVTTVDQVRQSLFNPDLVREALADDPDGEVKRAGKVVNLDKVLASGPAPGVSIVSPAVAAESSSGLIVAEGNVADRGMGVGRVEWRVNGVTAAVQSRPKGAGPVYSTVQRLALDPGRNVIELIAYNRDDLLASPPTRAVVEWRGGGGAVKGRLHVLAIGIDAYSDITFRSLKHAVDDAKAVGAAFAAAAGDLYDGVTVEYALDGDATHAKLDRLVEKMAGTIGPRDTFVLFAAAHGMSEKGRFYLIPHGFRSDAPGSLSDKAIGQDELQDWLANRVKARRGLVLLDTCASGALVGGYTNSRIDAPASEAAIGRLHEAVGRPVLTAAASGMAAIEGYQEHGVFTWALLDALKNGDRNGDNLIEISELAAHVQAMTPDLGRDVGKLPPSLEQARGALRFARTRVEARSSYRQSARLGSTDEDFALVKRIVEMPRSP